MNTRFRALILFIGILFASLSSCKKDTSTENTFTVDGKVANTKEQTIYLEQSNAILDSTTIDNQGRFQLKAKAPLATDFYNIRLGKQLIHFVVDSIETIAINIDGVDFARNYSITGSGENQKIKDISLLQLSALSDYKKAQKQYESKEISADEYLTKTEKIVQIYKDGALVHIGNAFDSPSAYFAVLQQIDKKLIFDPYDRKDLRIFGAVANNYPDSARGEYIKNIYLNGYTALRGEPAIDAREIDSKELFELSLPDTNGKTVKLSNIGEGKLTLIDFTVYEASESPFHNIQLAEIYEKYRSKGFEIYQVALDANEHYWKNAAYNLPWIKVRDEQSIYSTNLTTFNVSKIPTSFLRNKDGVIVVRIESYDDLEAAIKKHLK